MLHFRAGHHFAGSFFQSFVFKFLLAIAALEQNRELRKSMFQTKVMAWKSISRFEGKVFESNSFSACIYVGIFVDRISVFYTACACICWTCGLARCWIAPPFDASLYDRYIINSTRFVWNYKTNVMQTIQVSKQARQLVPHFRGSADDDDDYNNCSRRFSLNASFCSTHVCARPANRARSRTCLYRSLCIYCY